MTQDEIVEKLKYWQNIPRELWDKDRILDISFEMNRHIGVQIDEMDQFIADLIKEHKLVLTENQKLFIQNSRMKHTIKQLTSRDN